MPYGTLRAVNLHESSGVNVLHFISFERRLLFSSLQLQLQFLGEGSTP